MTTTDNELEKLIIQVLQFGEWDSDFIELENLIKAAHTLGKKEGRREGFMAARVKSKLKYDKEGLGLDERDRPYVGVILLDYTYLTLADYEKEMEKEI